MTTMIETVERQAVFTGHDQRDGANAVLLAPALRAALLAAGRDDTLPVLTCVRVELPDGGGVRFSATDRYRLHAVGVGCDPMPDDSAPAVLIPVKSMKPLVPAWKPAGLMYGAVTLRFAGSGLEVVTDGKEGTSSVVLSGMDGAYPNLGMLLSNNGKNVDGSGDPATFNPAYLSDLVTAAGHCVDRNQSVRLRLATGHRPAMVDVAPESPIGFMGIVMPVRNTWA